MIKLKLYGTLALILLVVIVIFQNTQAVETRLLFMSFTMPRAALLLIMFLVGTVAGLLLPFALAQRMPRRKH